MSAFYPPRAHWYAPVFTLGNAIRRRLALDRLRAPRGLEGLSAKELLGGFLVPGLAVYLRGPRWWGQAAMVVSFSLFITYIVWLGTPAANLAFGFLLSLHSTGFIYYCNPVLAHESLRSRLVFTVLVLLALALALYWPARNFLQNHLLTPLRFYGQTYIVQRNAGPRSVHRGEWVAYTLDNSRTGHDYHGGVVQLRSGITLGPVLAVAGDTVTFSTNTFSVNGAVQTNLPHMPQSGGFTVAEKHWFIWPQLDISGHGNVGEARICEALLGLSDVGESDFYGKPLSHWFWRKQILP